MRYIFFIILFFNSVLFALEPLSIKQCNTPYNIGKNTQYFVDSTNTLTLHDVINKHFTTYTKNILNFGFLQPTHWFKIRFQYNKKMIDKRWWLQIDYPHLDSVDYYLLNNKNKLLAHKVSGDLQNISKRDLNHTNILFLLPNNSTQTYTIYLRVQTTSSMQLPIQIISETGLFKQTRLEQAISGLYYGILIILILYSLITFVYTREDVYGYYVLYTISFALWQLSFDGLGMLYFWDSFYWMREKGIVFFIYTSTLTLLIFSQAFLKSKSNIPKMHKFLLQPLKYTSAIGIFFSVIFPYEYTIVLGAILGLIVPAALFSSGLLVLHKDYHSIKFFVLGWGIFLIATVLFALSKFDLIGGYIIMKYGQQIGSAFDLVFLSIGLAQRFNGLKDEYTQKISTQADILRKRVEYALAQERKKDQFILEQAKFASLGEMIEQIAHQWRQPLNNIGLINQDIYFKKILGTLTDEEFERFHSQIDTSIDYLSNTINDFRDYNKANKEKEMYLVSDAITTVLHITEATLTYHKINVTLKLDNNLKVHNMKSEFFQVLINILNNAKDALIDNNIEEKKIEIHLTRHYKNALLTVLDNGGGIPQENLSKIFDSYFTTKENSHGTGIGLYMSQNIIQQHMNGNIEVHNKNDGACFKITLPLANEKS